MNKIIPWLVVILVVIGAGYLVFKNNLITPQPTSAPTPTSTPQVTPANTPASTPTPTPSDWLTYQNSQYGFEISYPKTYKALDDKENLYGWPNAAVLLYKGGQSYDIAVEVWDSETQYKIKYPKGDVIVQKAGNKFFTLSDITKKPENAQIIATFLLKNSP